MDATTTIASKFTELGYSGLKTTGGYLYEEALKSLQGNKAAVIFREMREQDPICGAIAFAIEQIVKGANFDVEAGGDQNVDREAQEYLKSCMTDMSESWSDFISEVFSMLTYGWSYHEQILKIRSGQSRDPKKNSRYNDGRLGWRKLPIRSQDSLSRWEFDESGGIQAMIQYDANYNLRTIPISKALLFRTKIFKNSPEGYSIFHNAFRPWWFKKRIEESEAIGIERDLAGLPVLEPPDGVNIYDTTDPSMVTMRANSEKLIKEIRRDKIEGVLKPPGWKLELLTTGGRRQFDTTEIIKRYDQRIAISVLAQLVMLGSEKVGSYSLGETHEDVFLMAIDGWLLSAAEVINNYAVVPLFSMQPNAFPGLTSIPKIRPSKVRTPNLTQLADYVTKLSGSGALTAFDENLEAYLRQVGGLPQKKGQ